MNFELSHPFKNCPDTVNIPKDKQRDVEDIYRWMCDQPRFPKFTRNHAYLFLHACLWDVPNTKRTIQKYIKIRGSSPDLFDNRDPKDPGIQNIYNITHMVGMPIKTQEGYKVLCYRLSDTDPSKVNFAKAIKAFCMFNDVMISQDGIIEGYIVVFDMKGLRLGHLTKIQLGALRTFMSYIQEAHPVRLKKIYVVHTASFINQVMAIIKPLIKSELLGLLHFTPKGPSDLFPLALLPEDYGGALNSLEKYHNDQRRMLETEYRDWLLETNNFKELPKETNNNNSSSFNNNTTSTSKIRRSLRTLEID